MSPQRSWKDRAGIAQGPRQSDTLLRAKLQLEVHILCDALQFTARRASVAALILAFEDYNFTAVGFKPVPHEEDAARGCYMRVNFKADRRILENENADAA